jgi:glycine betaine/proline transport system substrate-binding protein
MISAYRLPLTFSLLTRPLLAAAALVGAATLAVATPAAAADPAACKTVSFSDPGWTDITSTNALTGVVLQALGYEQKVELLAVPVTFQALGNKQIDVFLGNWMPAQQHFVTEATAKGAVVVGRNLEGAKFTLAVPTYVSAGGVKDFADLAKYADKFDKKIYGIEAGAPANQSLQKMITANDFGLGDWKLEESGEQAMLKQVDRSGRDKSWIVFLAWAPHPMNSNHALTYLSGGDKYFGPNYGGAEVYTISRAGFAEDCPNAAKLISNMTFTVDQENLMMAMILDQKMEANDAAKLWLQGNSATLDAWLDGVTTLDGKPGLDAVKSGLGL